MYSFFKKNILLGKTFFYRIGIKKFENFMTSEKSILTVEVT